MLALAEVEVAEMKVVSAEEAVVAGVGAGASTGGWTQPAISNRIIRMPAIRLFFISASEVTLWLECYTTGGILSIVCDDIAFRLIRRKKEAFINYIHCRLLHRME